MAFEYEKVLNEIYMAEPRIKAKTVLRNEDFIDAISPSNAAILGKKIEDQYNPKPKSVGVPRIFKWVQEQVRRMGIASGLGGILQPIKQVGIIANISSTLGKDADLFVKEYALAGKNYERGWIKSTKVKNKVHDIYSIGNRVEMHTGLDRGERQRTTQSRVKSETLSKAGRTLGRYNDIAQDFNLRWLHLQDVRTSVATWNAAYKGYLREKGITDVDMANEHLKQDEKVRQEAAAYAEYMVGLIMIPSDFSQKAEIMKNPTILQELMMPLNSFNMLALMRKYDAVNNIFNGGSKKKAGLELTGLMAESAWFNYSKYLIKMYLYPTAINTIYNLFSDDDEEKDFIKIAEEDKDKKFITATQNTVIDALLQGIPEIGVTGARTAWNYGAYVASYSRGYTDKEFKEWKEESPLAVEVQDDYGYSRTDALGIYGIAPSKFYDSFATTKLRTEHSVSTIFGSDSKKSISKEDEKQLATIELINFGNAMGWVDADVNQAARMARKQITADSKISKGGGLGTSLNSSLKSSLGSGLK